MPALRTTPLSHTWPQLLQPLGFTRRTIIWDAPQAIAAFAVRQALSCRRLHSAVPPMLDRLMNEPRNSRLELDPLYCLPLNAPQAALARVGGKGLNLTRLARAGFPVPGGFIVTVDAYFAFVTQAGLVNSLGAEAAAVNADDPDTLASLSDRLRELKVLAMNAPGDWKGLVRARRTADRREQRRQPIPRLLLSDGTAVFAGLSSPANSDAKALVGSGVSPGAVEGRVHVVFSPANASLQPGEILVCPGTDPSWTPIFLAAGGLVMEVGGMMTHGSVIAREYGVPAVVGVDRATERLQTGQRVGVDGGSGRVDLLD